MTDLQGRVAVVTGASGGIGARLARVLAKAGAAVAVAARRTDRLKALVAEIEAAGGRAQAFALDVADAGSIAPTFDRIEHALGPIAILVNNAGVSGAGPALDLSIETFDETVAVNTRAVYFGAREAAKRMLASGVAEAGHARIVNIASIGAFTNLGGVTAYCASKAAVASITTGLAREWGSKRISVNAICPGYIVTEMTGDWLLSEGGKKQVSRFPRRRVMDEGALDEALLLLSGPAAEFITGTLITVDDGQSL